MNGAEDVPQLYEALEKQGYGKAPAGGHILEQSAQAAVEAAAGERRDAMALYAIGDLHLSLNSDKPMDIFGEKWHGYVDKIRGGFAPLHEDDVTVLCGDLSWGMSLEESLEDFRFIHALPGKKILMKGNHDYWWNTAAKMQRFFDENGLITFEILHNNCLFYGDKAPCGTRGGSTSWTARGPTTARCWPGRRGGWRHR